MLMNTSTVFFKRLSWVFTFICVHFSFLAIARLGGAGGDGFSGGDGDSDFEAILLILEIIFYLFLLPFPYNVISIISFLILIFWGARKKRQSTVLNQVFKIEEDAKSDTVINSELAHFHRFNRDEFIPKVEHAFKSLQSAWSQKNIASVRRFISDGVYQRLNVQITMMNQLDQTNFIDALTILQTKIVNAYREGDYDVIEVKISASIKDRFVSKKYPSLNQNFEESFSEFWTFIRKKDAQSKDLYFDQKCPSCLDVLPDDLGEVSVCPSCGTFSNLGDYDWILSEITLASDYGISSAFEGIKNRLADKILALGDRTTIPQIIEDKASNAFLQLKAAEAFRDEKRVRRFCDSSYFDRIDYSGKAPFVFNRLYLSSVSMVNLFIDEEFYTAIIYVHSHEQKVEILNDKLQQGIGIVAHENYLVLKRNKTADANKGSVYSHRCTACGGSVEDSLDLECSFCGQILNDTKRDWIVFDLLTKSEYQSNRSNYGEPMLSKRKEDKMESHGLTARDYAINNIIVLLACDGKLNDQEKNYLKNVAGSMGYNQKKIAALWETNQLSHMAIMIPEDKAMQMKSLKLMEKAAAARWAYQ